MTPTRFILVSVLLPLTLAGCADTRPSTSSVGYSTGGSLGQGGYSAIVQPGHEEVRKAAAVMIDGIRRYDNGDFDDAIAILSAPELRAAPDAIRVEALKYIAFSYCVTGRTDDCRSAFVTALAIDADFDLSKGEVGHPMWGPVFVAAKADSEKDRVRMLAAHARERWRGLDLWRPR
jgi:hypothetical protein